MIKNYNEELSLDKEKFKDLIYYIICKCAKDNKIDRNIIYKIAYFSDFNFYEIYENYFTGEKYFKRENGPAPLDFEMVKNELIEESKIIETIENNIKYYSDDKSSIYQFNLFSKEELTVINNVIEKIGHMSSDEISEYSHGDRPWRVAEKDTELDYEFVFYRLPEYSVRIYEDE